MGMQTPQHSFGTQLRGKGYIIRKLAFANPRNAVRRVRMRHSDNPKVFYLPLEVAVSEHRSSEFGTAMSGLIGVAILVSAVYALTAGRFAAMNAGPDSQEEIAARLAPIGRVILAGETAPAPPATTTPSTATADAGPGATIYQKACTACHATGAAGAPKLGDKAAWEPRVAQGFDSLLNTAINGKGVMPPRGTCADCSDEDLKAAIEYMLTETGFASEPAAAAEPVPEPEPAPAAQEGMSGMSGETTTAPVPEAPVPANN